MPEGRAPERSVGGCRPRARSSPASEYEGRSNPPSSPLGARARCPCGASIGQLAYNYDGDLYTCDEGRMIGWDGDEIFKAGNVFKNSYSSIVNSPVTKGCILASNLEQQTQCFRCAYKSYCGVCPVYNYEAQRNIWGNIPSNERCKLFMGIFDVLFELLDKPKEGRILRKWVQK